MAAAQPQRESEPQRQPVRERYARPDEPEPEPKPGHGGPGEPPEPPGQDESLERSWLAWDLDKNAREARSSRNRLLGGLALLAFLAVAAVAAGLRVDEEPFWMSVGPVFAAAATGLVAYGIDRLGVFAKTAELLGLRGVAGGTAAAEQSESELPMTTEKCRFMTIETCRSEAALRALADLS